MYCVIKLNLDAVFPQAGFATDERAVCSLNGTPLMEKCDFSSNFRRHLSGFAVYLILTEFLEQSSI